MKLNHVTEFTLLGIQFSTQIKSVVNLNLDKKIKQIENLLKQYKRRNLSLLGRVTVVHTMALPQLVHVLSVIPSPGLGFIKKLESMFSEFIWNSKTGKVSRKLLAQEYCDGGLKLTHVESFIKALKIK